MLLGHGRRGLSKVPGGWHRNPIRSAPYPHHESSIAMRKNPRTFAFAAGLAAAWFPLHAVDLPDPVLSPGPLCAPGASGQPPLLRSLILARTETQPFQKKPGPAAEASGPTPLFPGLGTASFRISTSSANAQRYFNEGLRLAYGFNHAGAIHLYIHAV
jgi:hypothetical protein